MTDADARKELLDRLVSPEAVEIAARSFCWWQDTNEETRGLVRRDAFAALSAVRTWLLEQGK
jgi:hypothetical protein